MEQVKISDLPRIGFVADFSEVKPNVEVIIPRGYFIDDFIMKSQFSHIENVAETKNYEILAYNSLMAGINDSDMAVVKFKSK